MRSGAHWTKGTTTPVTAAVYTAGIALVVGYALSYLTGRLGMGVITGHGLWHGRSALMLAALNLYAAQHITLVGSGTVGGYGGPGHISASVSLPLTVWIIIPAFALMWGGYAAASKRSNTGRWGMIAPAVAGGLIYVAVLTALSRIISAKFVSAALPAIKGVEFNPPDIAFHPALWSTIWCAGLFAVVFTYLGALLATRAEHRRDMPSKWWACAKGVVVSALIIQVLIAGALWGWYAMNSRPADSEGRTLSRFTQMLPTGAGLGYALIHGSSISSGGVSEGFSDASYVYKVSLYKGVDKDEGGKRTLTRMSPYAYIAAGLGALGVLLSGWLSVRWGSRDGSLPTALRITLMHAIYMAILLYFSGIGWGIAKQFSVYVRPRYDNLMLVCAAGVLILALIGAHAADRRYQRNSGGFPSV